MSLFCVEDLLQLYKMNLAAKFVCYQIEWELLYQILNDVTIECKCGTKIACQKYWTDR